MEAGCECGEEKLLPGFSHHIPRDGKDETMERTTLLVSMASHLSSLNGVWGAANPFSCLCAFQISQVT
jgi:hypothetical protein